ncbi:hypothetical protein ACTND8_09735 [Atopobiaceae bacterium HCP3S3_F7]|uniref:hypothetical protein n=1 Tax=Coriobacteriia TaxID=84998 RepID=UPI003F8C661E
MGYQLVNLAIDPTLGQHLTHRARLALITMCHSAFDKPAPGRAAAEYYGGHAGIAFAITGRPGAPDNAGKLAAKRAIKELLDAGLIKRGRDAEWNRTASFIIVLGGRYKPALPVDNSDQPPSISTAEGSPQTPLRGSPQTPLGGHHRPL